jgi:hypothetical protein
MPSFHRRQVRNPNTPPTLPRSLSPPFFRPKINSEFGFSLTREELLCLLQWFFDLHFLSTSAHVVVLSTWAGFHVPLLLWTPSITKMTIAQRLKHETVDTMQGDLPNEFLRLSINTSSVRTYRSRELSNLVPSSRNPQ